MAKPKLIRGCAECGTSFEPYGAQMFCQPKCKATFNNRRAMRGAELYDMFMTLRHERAVGKALGVWRLICRMASAYRDEDKAHRGGRPSWRPAREVIDRHAYLSATIINSTTWRRVA